jgi:hypothetical protein
MTAEYLSALVAVILSLGFSYIPGLSAKYGALSGDAKRLIMLGLLAVAAIAIFALNCGGLGVDFGAIVSCDKAGAIALLKLFFTAVIANQATFAMTPASKSRS